MLRRWSCRLRYTLAPSLALDCLHLKPELQCCLEPWLHPFLSLRLDRCPANMTVR